MHRVYKLLCYPQFLSKVTNEPLRVTFPKNVLGNVPIGTLCRSENCNLRSAFLCFVRRHSLISITTLNHDMQAIMLPTMHHLEHHGARFLNLSIHHASD